MYLQLVYGLIVTFLFITTSDSTSQRRTRQRFTPHTLREVVAGINYIHHGRPSTNERSSYNENLEEKISALRELQRQNLAPNINLMGTSGEYETLVRMFTAEESTWSHEAQDRWPELYPSCGGNRQSPIHLPRPKLPTFGVPPLIWRNYNVVHPDFHLEVNSHTVDGSANWTQIPTLSGGPLTGEYRLTGIHWHWGMNNTGGAEHSVCHSKYVLEMHAVHYSTRYRNADEALNSGDGEAIAVVGIFFRLSSRSSRGIANVVNILRNGPSPSDRLLLSDFGLGDHSHFYYTYLGSLTTPPCYEIVKWIVMDLPQKITERELNVLRNLKFNGKLLGSNFRHQQPINGRHVEYAWC